MFLLQLIVPLVLLLCDEEVDFLVALGFGVAVIGDSVGLSLHLLRPACEKFDDVFFEVADPQHLLG